MPDGRFLIVRALRRVRAAHAQFDTSFQSQ
jgi:hypothetical protein